jgi:helicase, putative, RecD/TraA family
MSSTVVVSDDICIKAEHIFTIHDQKNWIIAKYKDTDTAEMFTACGTMLPTINNAAISLNGKWEDTESYGRQFKVASHSFELPTSKAGVVTYLSSLKVGIGKSRAQKIYNKFGDTVWDVIDNNPRALLSISGITENTLKELESRLIETRFMRELTIIFKGHIELTPARMNSIAVTFGKDAIRVVQETPYLLCNISDLGFPSVDSLALSQGAAPNTPGRILAAAQYILDSSAISGHTCLPHTVLTGSMIKLLNQDFSSQVVNMDECCDALKILWRNGDIKVTCKMVYSNFRFEQETSVADSLSKLVRNTSICIDCVDTFIDDYENENNITLADNQRIAISEIFRHSVSVITGGPGTGKTTIIKAALYVYNKVYGTSSEPLLLAPTGRAARRMSEATGYPSETIHAALGFRGESPDEDIDFVQVFDSKFIIMDEFSMADLYITSQLMKRIPPNARLIFVGDADQLPSVGYGNVLHDIIASASVPTIRLDVIFRQAQGNPIISNSQAIMKGITQLDYSQRTFRFFPAGSSDQIFQKACLLYIRCVNAYGLDNVVLLNPYRNKSDLSVDRFNKKLQDVLNPKVPDSITIKARGVEFRKGDKVMQTKNTDTAKNGDCGYIRDIDRVVDGDDPSKIHVKAYVEFNNDGVLLGYTADSIGHLCHAYCMTVHKSQGSEYATVIMVMSDTHKAAHKRNLLYTGITRAKTNLALVGNESAIISSIENTKVDSRYSLLKERLQKLLA